jgi:hypothetical protein
VIEFRDFRIFHANERPVQQEEIKRNFDIISLSIAT